MNALRPTLWCFVLALIGLGVCSQARADTLAQRLSRGQDLYYEGRYDQAVELLSGVASDDLSTQEQQIQALELLSICEFLRSNNRGAQAAWERLLELDPDHALDPVEVSPEIVEFFDRLSVRARPKPAGADAGSTSSGRPGGDDSPEGLADVSSTGPAERGCGVALCLIPYGAGQFANGRPGKGLTFAGLGAVFLAANVGLYWDRKLEFDKYGRFRDPDAADRKYILQHVALGLFIATGVIGVADAFLFP